MKLGKVRHVVAQEKVIRVGRPTVVVEHLYRKRKQRRKREEEVEEEA